jgi:hypothetical protein
MRAKFSLVILLCVFVASCGSSNAPVSGDVKVPTLAPLYSQHTPIATSESNADVNAVPTLAKIYISEKNTATPAPAGDPNGVPTPAPIFVPQTTRAASSDNADTSAPPTLAPVFEASAIPTLAQVVGLAPLPTSVPRTAEPKQVDTTPEPAATRPSITEEYIYKDALSPNWSLDHSENVKLNLKDSTQVKEGSSAVSVTFEKDFARAFFTVNKDSTTKYERAKAWGATLWLNTGENDFGPQDLSVTIIGSNAQPYYVPNDTSVTVDDKQFFSETRLVFFGVTRQLPRNTWIELTVELDKLPYDPDYKYITGIYVKNDKDIRGTIYIDQAALLMLK